MDDERSTIEITECRCVDCKGDSWKLAYIEVDDKTLLTITCANEKCVEKRKEELREECPDADEVMVIWEEFDITGQVTKEPSPLLPLPSSGESN
jgi:hypothetical protein